MEHWIVFIPVLFLALTPWKPARANTVLFTWAGNYNSGGQIHSLDGSVTFETVSNGVGGYNLAITLTNTSPEPTPGPDWILDGLYFNIQQGTTSGAGGTSPGALTPISATAYELANVTQTGRNGPYTVAYGSPGASICANSHPGFYGCASNTVNGGWEAAYTTSGLSGGQHWAIGTAKLGIFKGNNIGGIDYAIIPNAGINAASWSAGSSPYVYQSATFTLKGLSNSAIFVTQVAAAYGTGPSTEIDAILVSGETPEPGTVGMVLTGALFLLLLRRRRRAS